MIMPKFTFQPTISFDGVAIVSACILCSMWFGTLKETIRQHGEELKHHEQVLEQLTHTSDIQAQSIQVLTAIINERTGPATKK